MVAVAIVLGVVAWSLWPLAGEGGHDSRRECMARLSQLSGAVLVYAADHDDRVMPAPKWATAVAPYAGSTDALRCPAVERFGYAFHRDLDAKEIKKVASPEAAAMVFDFRTLIDNAFGDLSEQPSPPRHGKVNMALYVDGHARPFGPNPE